MSSFTLIMFLIGILGFIVSLIWLLISVIRRKSHKKVLKIFGGFAALIMLSILFKPGVLYGRESGSSVTTLEAPINEKTEFEKKATAAAKITPEQALKNKKIEEAQAIKDKEIARLQLIEDEKVAAAQIKADAQALKDAEAKKTAGKMTKAKFTEIKNGMNYEEVTKIIGGPGEVLSESGSEGDAAYTVMYQYEGIGSMGANSNLMFQGNKLMNKAQLGLK